MEIKVTSEHIKKGRADLLKPGSQPENCCPIAQALHEQGFPDAIVCTPDIQLYGTKAHYTRPPKSVLEFVRRFDTGRINVRPFTFELNVVKGR